MKKTSIYLDDLATVVSAAARQQGTSKAAFIREAITAHAATIERRKPSMIGSISVEGVRGADTEEWLLENWHPEYVEDDNEKDNALYPR